MNRDVETLHDPLGVITDRNLPALPFAGQQRIWSEVNEHAEFIVPKPLQATRLGSKRRRHHCEQSKPLHRPQYIEVGTNTATCKRHWTPMADLAFGVHTAENLPIVLSDWTAHMYDQHRALHHLDVMSGAWTYRVFLLPNTLQVDLAFVVDTEFRALAPTFRLMFGKTNEPRHASPPMPAAIFGLAWLYAVHARTCIARRKQMASGTHD
ncbi:MAG TPA: hypothetical protein VNY05_45940 [Candidatus Acidoferrales bacterium]|nr:hypothetical protein [Candidatus Acidoferrales bacterium]